ncbi:MAG: hypothetical protein BroJett040_11340 [Oligoflexia bacterium]|nr:MAG: hypothetical protein BroJett040_11340 [Oligoflexia bacterium]
MKNTLLPIAMISLIGVGVQAVPTLYPTDPTKLSQIKNNTDSNLVVDDVDTNRIYVMPPNTAMATSTGIHTISAYIGFCKEISDSMKYSQQMQARINELELEAAQGTEEVKRIKKELYEARKAASDFAANKNLTALAELDARISSLETRLSELYKASESCKDDCDEINNEIRDVNNEKTKMMKDRRELAKENTSDVRQYEKLKARVESIKANLLDASEGFQDINARLLKAKAQIAQLLSSYSKMEGGRAGFVYSSKWNENIGSLRTANPGMSFEKIQTANAKVHSSLIGLDRIAGFDRPVLAFELPGAVSQNGVLELPTYPQSISANVVLSLLGVCPIKYPEYFNFKTLETEKDMKYGMTVTYEYPSSFKLSVTAKYNMYKMYQKVVSSGSSGGFFSSRSWTDVSERTDFKDAFRIEWKEQDPSNTISDEERIKIEQDMKVDIFKRMLTIAMPTAPDKGSIITAMAPPAHGAVVISDSLMKVCPANIYCVGGAAVMTVLDAIFGNSSSVASYTQTQNFELVQAWSKDKVSLKPWITTYTK